MRTSESRTGEWLLGFLKENAFAIMVAIFAAWSWFQSSNATLTGKVEVLEREVANQRDALRKRDRFINDATNQLNFLCATAPTCRQLYAPIVAPE
jgi:hypothetical protein